MSLPAVPSLLAACLVLIVGDLLAKRVPLLARFSIPAPIVGGVLFALGAVLVGRLGFGAVTFDSSAKSTFLLLFFASVGLTADLALLLSVQAGDDPRTPNAIRQDPASFAAPRPRELRGLRVGWIGDFGGHLAFEPGVLDLCEAGLKVFAAQGAAVEPVRPAFDPEAIWRAWLVLRQWITGANLSAHWRDPEKRALMKPEAVWEVEQGQKLSAFDVHAASVTRTA